MDRSKGFVKNDTIILHAEIVADAPHGIKYVMVYRKGLSE